MEICTQFLVSGHVHGVWFRAATQQKANSLGITGYAENLPDGRVEVLACGERDSVTGLGEWLWQGSPHSDVSDVKEIVIHPKGRQDRPDSFEIR